MNANSSDFFWILFDERDLRESWIKKGRRMGEESRHCVDTCYEDYIKDAVCSLYAVCESE